MTETKSVRVAWLAPLLVGFAAATAAEIAVGVLLYAGPGLMRSLTLVLGVEAAALGVGMWAASRTPEDVVEAVRRRWLLCLIAYLIAAMFAALWTFVETLGGAALGQGLGLAFLAALPLYACGGVLATIAGAARSGPGAPFMEPGAPAALGAAFGFVVTGLVLPQLPSPSSLLLACIAVLSLGGLVQGAMLARRSAVRLVAERREIASDVRVEDRHVSATALRVLLEGRHVRRWMVLQGDPAVPWDVSVMRAAMPATDEMWRILLVGGGASALPRAALREHPGATVDVLERSPAVVELGHRHLETDLLPGGNGRMRVWLGNLEDLVRSVDGAYDLVLLDRGALDPLGGVQGLSRAARETLARKVAPHGTVAWGPRPPEEGERVAGWTYSVHERKLDVAGLTEVRGSDTEVVLLGSPPESRSLPVVVGGFAPVDLSGTASSGAEDALRAGEAPTT